MLGALASLVMLASPDPAVLDAALAEVIRTYDLPAGTVAIVSRGHLVWARPFGQRGTESGGRVHLGDVFDVGSVTKTFTALAILQLRDAGRLTLDDEITTWVPEAELLPAGRGDRRPTIRDLLLHRSGFPRDGHFDTPADRRKSEDELAADLHVQLEAAPGSREVYSNLGYSVLGLIVQRASGRGYHEYVEDHLLVPMGIEPCWQESDMPDERRVLGRVRPQGDRSQPWQIRDRELDPTQMGAAGALCASTPELMQLVLLELGELPDAPVSRDTVAESQQAGVRGSSTGYGVSQLTVSGVGPVTWKNGMLSGFSTSVMAYLNHDVGLVLEVAASDCDIDAAASDLLRAAVRGELPRHPR